MDSVLLKELASMTDSASPLRRGYLKWASFKVSSDSQPVSEDVLLLSVPGEEGLLGFSLESVRMRVKVKRMKVVFGGMYSVWRLVNPFALKGISKPVFAAILVTVYRSVFPLTEDYPDLERLVATDIAADFASFPALVYSVFYHSLFNVIDSCTRSKLASEYVRALNKLAYILSNTDWMDNKDLHSRLHLGHELPPMYEAWMKPLLREIHAPNLKEVQESEGKYRPSAPYTTSNLASQRYILDSRTVTAPANARFTSSAGFTAKPSTRLPTYLRLNLDPPPPLPPSIIEPDSFHTPTPGPLKPRLRFKRLKHLYLTSPLSKIAVKGKKESSVLEEILSKRANDAFKITSPLDI